MAIGIKYAETCSLFCIWLKVEGIFRINAENSQGETVRNQLNSKGVVPYGIDVHCLAGLIKVALTYSSISICY